MMLRAQHLTMRFGGVAALRDVSLELGSGEIHAVCGENGAGKSTLIKLLSGVYPHGSYEGRLELAGREARFRSIRDATAAGIAVVHQELTCIDELTVAENIFLGHEPTRMRVWVDGTAARRLAGELLTRFAVPLDPGRRMGSLGVGQKQLIEIVKALARRPRILILDEPTAALAEHEVRVLLRMLREQKTQGTSCIYISHRLNEVFEIADRISVLRDGALIATLDAYEADETTVVQHMVGRAISNIYAKPEAEPGETLLSVRGLSVADDTGAARLHELSFELHAGEVLGIGGLMGAGRSELLMHLFGVWGRRLAGSVAMSGQSIPLRDPRAALDAGLALVTEDRRRFGLFLGESVGFNLSLSALGAVARAGFVRRTQETARNQHWLESLRAKSAGLAGPVGRLSGGNQQKIVLGKALMRQPRVIMLDEPTRGIDVGAKLEIYSLIHRLTRQGCGVLLVASDLPELIGMSDRIVMLCDGVAGGTFERGRLTADLLMEAALGSTSALPAGTKRASAS